MEDVDSGNAPKDEAEEISALARAIRLQRGFGLYFVSVSQSDHRRRLLETLAEKLPGAQLHHIFLRQPPDDSPLTTIEDSVPPGTLPAASDAAPRTVLCLYGLENWLAGIEGVRQSRFAAALNTTRNSFAAALGCPLVILAPQYVIVGLQLGTPDFFSVRSGVYFFDSPPDIRNLYVRSKLYDVEHRAALGAGIEGRHRQITEWEDILHGYEALPEDRYDPLLEAKALHSLAVLHDTNGDYTHALPLYERALKIYESTLGQENPNTAAILSNLAGGYNSIGDYIHALPLYERALSIYEAIRGPMHPDTATSLDNLAEIYRCIGDYALALPLYERALDIREIMLGPEHPSTATSLNNLALLYDDLGNYERALPLYERALKIDEAALGPEHPEVATDLNNLSGYYRSSGDYVRALMLLQRAFKIREATLGPEHPDTITTLNNLAVVYAYQANFTEAEILMRRVLPIQIRTLGRNHPNTVGSQQTLNAILEAQGNLQETL